MTLSRVAQGLGYSAVYAGSIVKKLTGRTFTEYLLDVRLARATELLCETDAPVSEIISMLGYENGSFFRKKFREKYGKTPYHYRKTMRGEK